MKIFFKNFSEMIKRVTVVFGLQKILEEAARNGLKTFFAIFQNFFAIFQNLFQKKIDQFYQIDPRIKILINKYFQLK